MRRINRKMLLGAAILGMMLSISGCVPDGSRVVTPRSTDHVLIYDKATVTSFRYLSIQPDAATIGGAAAGALAGSAVGSGGRTVLAAMGGALAGGYIGSHYSAPNAQELTLRLDNGRRVVVTVNGTGFRHGERVYVVRDGNRIVSIQPIVMKRY
ncbi:hypothetical protein [Nitratifractor sp.]